MFWGIVLLLPGDLFAGIERYKFFGRYAPDYGWGLVFIVAALAILIRKPQWAHMNAHAILCAIWFGMGILSTLSVVSPPVLLITSLCVTVSIIHATKFWRLQQQFEAERE